MKMEQPQQLQKRFPAIKLRIKDIINGNYVRNENELSYLDVSGSVVHRVNLIGAVVVPYSPDNQVVSVLIDDGSGRISLRSFDNPRVFDGFAAGDLVLVIGKPREFNNEKYVIAEIIKRLDDKQWIKVRELELKKHDKAENSEKKVVAEKQPEATPDSHVDNVKERVFQVVQELDLGDGVEIEAVIARINVSNADLIITEMIKEGSVFQVKPGRIKVV